MWNDKLELKEYKNGYLIIRNSETYEMIRRIKIGRIYVKMTTNERNIGVYEKSEFLVYDEIGNEIANLQEEINGTYYIRETENEIKKEIEDEVSKNYGIPRNKVQVEF